MVTSSSPPLASVLFGKARRELLSILYSHPDERFYLRQLVRITTVGVGAIQRELAKLTQAGIIRREVQGNQVYFQADARCPVFPEIRGLIAKTAGIADILRDALSPVSARVDLAFVYGSIARGEEKKGSDVDLLIVGDLSLHDVVKALSKAQEKLAREVNPTVYAPSEFGRKLTEKHHFLTTVLKGAKIFLVGTEDDLSGLAEKRLAPRARDKQAGNKRPAKRNRARS